MTGEQSSTPIDQRYAVAMGVISGGVDRGRPSDSFDPRNRITEPTGVFPHQEGFAKDVPVVAPPTEGQQIKSEALEKYDKWRQEQVEKYESSAHEMLAKVKEYEAEALDILSRLSRFFPEDITKTPESVRQVYLLDAPEESKRSAGLADYHKARSGLLKRQEQVGAFIEQYKFYAMGWQKRADEFRPRTD